MYQIFVVYRFRDSGVHTNLTPADFAKRLYYDFLVVQPRFIELADKAKALTLTEFQSELSKIWTSVVSNTLMEYNKYEVYDSSGGQLKKVSLLKLDIEVSGISEWVYNFIIQKNQ